MSVSPPTTHASLNVAERATLGGRQSVSGIISTVFGSSGFLGRYVVNHLGRIGSQVITPYRGDGMNVRHHKLSGDLGQIVPAPCELADADALRRVLNRSNVVVNLIGAKHETLHYSYHDTNVKCAYRIAKFAKECGVERFIHISCVGAAEDSPSAYFRSKYDGELAVRHFYPDATIIRPTTVFGPEDRFLNAIATMGNKLWALPVINGGEQPLQPIHVIDVAKAVLSAIIYEDSIGKTYEIGGPDVMTLQSIIKLINHASFSHIKTVSLPAPIAQVYGVLMGGKHFYKDEWHNTPTGRIKLFFARLLSMKRAPVVFHYDMIAQAKCRQVVDEATYPGLAQLGVVPSSLITEIDQLMLPHRPEGVAPERFPDPESLKLNARTLEQQAQAA